jgi:hypothetical protein
MSGALSGTDCAHEVVVAREVVVMLGLFVVKVNKYLDYD